MDKLLEDIDNRQNCVYLSSDSESEEVASTSAINSSSVNNLQSTSGEVHSTVIGFGSLPKPEHQGAVKIKKLLSDLQFSNPGDQNKIGLALPKRRRGRPAKFTTEEELQKKCAKANKEIKHDRDGNLLIDGKTYKLCDCLKVECNGCQWPCKKCGGRMCNPIHCQKNRRLLMLRTETQGVEGSKVINPLLEEYLPNKF